MALEKKRSQRGAKWRLELVRKRKAILGRREMEIWRGGRIRGARKKKRSGGERRRISSGEEIAMAADEFLLRLLERRV